MSLIGLIAADAMRDEIERQDIELKASVNTMRALQSQIKHLAGLSESATVSKLADSFKYSDPVSHASTEESETELEIYLDELQKAIVDNDADSIDALCQKTEIALAREIESVNLENNY